MSKKYYHIILTQIFLLWKIIAIEKELFMFRATARVPEWNRKADISVNMLFAENIYKRQNGILEFLPFNNKQTKSSKCVKLAVPGPKEFPAMPVILSHPG